MNLVVLRRAAGVIAALVGVVFLIVGLFLLASSFGTSETATVQTCRTELLRSGTGHSGSTHYICMVQWGDGGQVHQSAIDLGTKPVETGSSVKLKVNGAFVTEESPSWAGWVMIGIAAALFVGGGFAIFTTRRSRRPRIGVAGP